MLKGVSFIMTTNQHFIPQFYQRYWQCERKGYIWALDKKFSNVRQRPIKSNCSIDNLYEVDEKKPTNIFENFYREEIEDKYAKDYARLINSRNCRLYFDLADKTMICRLYSNFSARNIINLYKNPQNHALVSHFTLGGNIDRRIERKWLLNVLPFSGSDFEEKLLQYGVHFLVLDKPNIIFSDCLIEQVCYADEYYFPICPYIVAYFSKKNTTEDGVIKKITDEEYKRFLDLYINSSYILQLYSNNRNILDDINRNYHFYYFQITTL